MVDAIQASLEIDVEERISLDENIDRVTSLLEKLGISNIISVDDSWVTNNFDILEILMSAEKVKEKEHVFNKILEKSIAIQIEIDALANDDEFEIERINQLVECSDFDDFIRLLNLVVETDLVKFCEIIQKFFESDGKYQTTEENLKKLAGLLKKLEAKEYNVKVLEKYEEIHTKLNGRSLWLLDRDMHGSREHIFTILKSIIERKDVALIVTNDDGELESREEIGNFVNKHIANYEHLDTSTLWVLKKDKVETEELATAIKNVLQGYLIHNINSIQKNIHAQAIEKAEHDLKFIDPVDYEKYFSVTYFEGSHINETIFRIKDALINKYLNESLSDLKISEELLGYRKLLERLSQENIKELEGKQNERLVNLDENEKIVKIHSHEQWEYSVNSMVYPIYTGDLFCITTYNSRQNTWDDTKKVLLLITQPCDTIIRKYGENIARGAKYALVIKGEFFAYGTGGYKRAIGNQVINKFKVHFLNHMNKFGIVEFDAKDVKQIDCRVLDLCSLDEKGLSLLDKKNLEKADLMPALSFKYYKEEMNKFIDKCCEVKHERIESEFNKLIQDKQELGQDIINLNIKSMVEFKEKVLAEMKVSSIKNEIMLPADIEFFPKVGFNLRRIARLKDPYTIDIINKSTDYLTRQGMPTIMV